ncbi:beta-ketoacyl-ACP synthase II [Desulfatibacillum aliphaticivorans]|uniref:beta-ketoacyl-ACP synthase II n=1 Tax=Desulfatibacillum aliphaticivorans TaxID=218208 RepID=UPI00040BCABF|nr:beta-ketoacyl-ACP synthase II [Desulfatibacillum aliphaticivorans]
MNTCTPEIVVTGLGLVTPLGVGVESSWSALCQGKSGVGPITRFDTAGFKTTIAAEVKDFNAEDFMSKKEARKAERFIAYIIAASKMALDDAGLVIDSDNAERVGVFTGCGLGGLQTMEESRDVIVNRGPGRVSPFFIPMLIGNMGPGLIAIHFGAKGPNCSVATACAAGTHSVGESMRILQHGQADAMITGGVESVITPLCIAGFNSMKALSTRNEEPKKASRPFDKERDGFVVGEGAGILILETREHAEKRGARIYATLAGYGMSGDAYHMTAPSPEGEGMARCMKSAVEDAGLPLEAIDYINAHGTSTQFNDLCETQAVKSLFGEHAYKLAISSTKSMTGHLLGGAGGVESVFTALTVYHDLIPPTINQESPDPECDLDYVPNQARKQVVNAAMNNSFGFGGTNASVIMKKFKA